jgi:hypothetical protein
MEMAFPNLPRHLAGRINDLGNLSYLRHDGATVLRRDVIDLFDGTIRKLNRRLAIQRANIGQSLQDDEDEPSDVSLAMCSEFYALCSHANDIRSAFQDILKKHTAFFEANRSSLLVPRL